jgi:thiamine monophosphate synthase
MLALGGMAPGRIRALRHKRLAGVAMIRALWNAPDPAGTVDALRAEWAG